MASALVLLLVVVCCKSVQSEFAFSCDENIIAVSPPVVNETSYGYHIRISIEGRNETLEAYELSNPENGSLLLYVNYPNETNVNQWITEMINHDYKYNQTFHVIGDWGAENTCTVSDLMHNETYSIFGMGIENGFQNPEFSYKWTGDYNYTKGNETIVNGIRADVYSTCLLFNNSQMKYDVDLYFSQDEWNIWSGKNSPLMVVLKVNRTVDGGSTFEPEKYTFSFTSYHGNDTSGKHSARMPESLICPGRKDTIDFPYVGYNYAVSQEIINKEKKSILSWRQHYNYDEKLYRVDFLAPRNFSRPHAPKLFHHRYTVIHDFESGIEYLMDREVGNCSVGPITNSTMWSHFDVEADPTHPGFFRMRNIIAFLNKLNMTYTGRHSSFHTGITYDSWTSAVPYKTEGSWGSLELRETYKFTTVDWTNGDLTPVPIGVKVSMKIKSNGTVKNNDIMIHMSNVMSTGHALHAFDIGMCQNYDNSKTIVLKFSDNYAQYLSEYSTELDVAIQKAVANAARVSKIRVSSYSSKEIGPDQSSGKDGADWRVFITVTLYDQPNFHGNTSEYSPSINLTEAVSKLKKAVSNNILSIKFKIFSGETITMTAYPDYFMERSELYSPPPSSVTAGLSNGAIAAICIAMTLVGFIAGALVCFFKNKRSNRQFGYGIQD
ncbi:uncharacterized protein LOC120347157 [Styela clava]